MNTSILHPPNSRHLSDKVISGMVQYPRHVSSFRVTAMNDFRQPSAKISEYVANNTTNAWNGYRNTPQMHQPEEVRDSAPRPTKRKKSDTTAGIDSRYLKSVVGIRPLPTTEAAAGHTNYEEIVELLTLGKELKRTRGREIQTRYRKRMNDSLINLEKDNQILREEIKKLKRQLRGIGTEDARHPTSGTWQRSISAFYVDIFSGENDTPGSQHCPRAPTSAASKQ